MMPGQELELLEARDRALREVDHAIGACDCWQWRPGVAIVDWRNVSPVSYEDLDGRYYVVDELADVPDHLFAIDLVLVDGVWQLPRC